MQEFTFYSPTKIVFGKGAEEKTAAEIREFGGSRVMLVYGGGSVVRSGLLKRLEAQLNPDWALVELSGLALTKDLRTSLRPLAREGMEIRTVAIADAARFLRLQKACALILGNQMQQVDLILLNKTDLQPVTEELLEAVRSINDQAPILPVCAVREEPLWEQMETVWREQHDGSTQRP